MMKAASDDKDMDDFREVNTAHHTVDKDPADHIPRLSRSTPRLSPARPTMTSSSACAMKASRCISLLL